MGGYGEGTLTVTPEGQAPLRPDMDFVMGALGVRGVLLDGGADGPTLAAKSDAMAVRTSTDGVLGSGGNAGLTLGDGESGTGRTGARWQLGADAVVGLKAAQQPHRRHRFERGRRWHIETAIEIEVKRYFTRERLTNVWQSRQMRMLRQ